MVSALNTRTWINRAFGSGKDIVPDPGGASMRVFTIQGVWQVHLPISCEAIFFVEELHPGKMPLQGRCQRPGEHGDAVLGSLPVAHGDLVVSQIDLLHTQAHAFHEAQASAIEQAGHHVGHTSEPGE